MGVNLLRAPTLSFPLAWLWRAVFLAVWLPHWSGVHAFMWDTHTQPPHLGTLFQSKAFWRKVTGESGALTARAAVL